MGDFSSDFSNDFDVGNGEGVLLWGCGAISFGGFRMNPDAQPR